MKLVIVDRDGVVNEDSPDYIRSPSEIRPIAGSLEAIARFTQSGVHVAIATNQSGLARGLFDVDALNRMHSLLCSRAAAVGGRIDLIAFCPHGPDDHCRCRKPGPALLESIAARFSVTLDSTPFIGDSLRDLKAAACAGARPVLVRTGNGAVTAGALPAALAQTPVFDDLRSAAERLLAT
ncbi:D-glycero-beta-D-manno-heptose 1,7-bisphosphate 7-phosphatase [uncultured Thiohalocapsa sp.]|uniref:D-glycero-beta-D-manno-heptose 1,7-bisphosphate 7-phosphatase n=1 Tax=uncultured Thiohalocapsa sp. TaxID=768990 RepID=UPI0025FCAA14|nr:D-glycero-beta-D-manno-heptose 1,7-bisphosphate 7-phosphatase [uncultured Thiohalocapsa sp.]